METVFTDITDYLLKQSWQIAILFAVVAIVCLAIRKKSAHLRYLLWLLIIAKCLVPSLITVSLAILPQKPLLQPLPESAPIREFAPPPETVILSEAKMPAPLAVPRPSIMAQLAQIRPKTWFSGIWLGGVGLFLLIVLIKAARFNRRLKGQRKRLTAGMQKEIDELLVRFGVHAKLRIWLFDGIGQPFVWGLLRGAIYLPANFGQIGGREHRRGILMHEITHVARFDAAVNCLQTIAQAVFWFHPLVWWANRNIRAEREKCCDETAIARLSAAPKVYSSAIVDTLIAEYQSTQPVPSLAIAGPIKNIEDRIKTIMKPGKKFYNRPTIIAIITILLLAIAAVPTTIALTHRQDKKPEEFLAKEKHKALRGIDEKLNVSDKAGELTINSLYMTSPDGKNLLGNNSVTLFVGVTNNSQKELYLGFEYYTDSGTVAKVFSPGASIGAQIRKIASNWEGRIEFPIRYNRFVKGGYVKITLAKCSGSQFKETKLASLPIDSEVLHEKKYVILPREKEKASSKFIKTLPNGVTVELVGVCEHPSAGKQWWQPNGNLMELVPYDKIENPYLKHIFAGPDSQGHRREFALRLSGVNVTEHNIRWRIIQSNRSLFEEKPIKNGAIAEGLRAIAALIPIEDSSVRVEIGIADGPFKRFVSGSPDFDNSFSFIDGQQGNFTNIREIDGETTLTVAENLSDFDYRVIAIDKSDNTHLPSKMSLSNKIDNTRITTVEFNGLPLENIKEFQLQTRPYEWAKFKNVALRPNNKPAVQVEVQNSLATESAESPAPNILVRDKNTENNQKPDVQVEGRVRPNNSVELEGNEPADKYNQMLEPLNRQRQELEKELKALRNAYDDTEHLAGVRLTVSNAELETVGWFKKRYVAGGVVRCEMPNQLLMQAETAIWPDSFEVHTARTAAYLKDRDFLQEVIRRDKVRRTKWFQARKKDMEKVIDSLTDSLTVQVKDTADIEVKFTAADPGDARTILDELLQLFILRKTDQAQNELTKKMADLHEEKSKLKRSIVFLEDEKQTLQKGVQETQEPDVQVEDEDAQMKARAESAEKLKELGLALYIYASEHDNEFPESLEPLEMDYLDEELIWARQNAEYMGKDKVVPGDEVQPVPLAFDKTLLKEGEGTNVVFSDGHVGFREPARLKELDIALKKE